LISGVNAVVLLLILRDIGRFPPNRLQGRRIAIPPIALPDKNSMRVDD
jgi:hypothetical protein